MYTGWSDADNSASEGPFSEMSSWQQWLSTTGFLWIQKKNLEGNLEDNPLKNKESKIALLLRKF